MAHVCVAVNHRKAPLYLVDPHAREQSIRTRDAVCAALQDLGHSVTVVEAGPPMLGKLSSLSPDVVFNLATGYRTKKEQANIAAMLEMSGIPFTGSPFRAHVLGLHKHMAKMVMGLHGIPTPRFALVHEHSQIAPDLVSMLRFPVIVKPAAEGSSTGISPDSVAGDPESVSRTAEEVLERFGAPALIEEFVDGREFTVGLVGYPEPAVLPIEEIVFPGGGIYTYEVKSRDAVLPVCPADISSEMNAELQEIAWRTFNAVGCLDLGRVDIRLSRDGRPYVLEINTLPGLMPGYSEIPRMAEKAGISYTELVRRVLEGALLRRDALTKNSKGRWQDHGREASSR